MANFQQALSLTLQNEGGYQALSADNGNYNSLGQLVGTNFGISAPTYERYLGHPPTVSDMKNMSLDTATAIYQADYWNSESFSSLNSQSIANQLFDINVLQGPGAMAKLAQQALNAIGISITVDGAFGPATRSAINSATSSGKEVDLNNQLADLRGSALGSTFAGWATRAESYFIDLASASKKKLRYF